LALPHLPIPTVGPLVNLTLCQQGRCTMTSTCCISNILSTQGTHTSLWAPKKLWVPSSSWAGPRRILRFLWSQPGSGFPEVIQLGVAIPQWYPSPRFLRQGGTHHGIRHHRRDIYRRPRPDQTPSAMTGTYFPSPGSIPLELRHNRRSLQLSTSTPNTPREVPAAPGPMPTSTAAAPAFIKLSATS